MIRRGFLGRLFGFSALALAGPEQPSAPQTPQTPQKSRVLIKSAWGSADPTQAAFAFHHAIAFAGAGHQVQIFLLGEAVTLMRSAVAASIVPVGWPPLAEAMTKALEHKVPIHV
jgi:predicted peroxiredoxin